MSRNTCLSRDLELSRVGAKCEIWRFSKSISSAIYGPRSGLILDYESMGQYLNSIGPDFWISVSFLIYEGSKVTENAVLYKVQTIITHRRRVAESNQWYHRIEQLMDYHFHTSCHVCHATRVCHVTWKIVVQPTYTHQRRPVESS